MRTVKIALVALAGTIFLPLVMKAGAPEPFSLQVSVRSTAYESYVQEPYVEVALRPTSEGPTLFQGFTNRYGDLSLGLFAGLPQELYVEVKRDRVDGALQHTLPLIQCSTAQVAPRGTLSCYAEYDYDQGTQECDCWSF